MPPTRRSETAPRKSSRVSELDKAHAARESAKQQRVEAEEKAKAAAERKAKAAKSKGKGKKATAVKRKAPAKRKAEEDGEGEKKEEVKKVRGAPKARGEAAAAKEDDKEKEEAAEEQAPAGEEANDAEADSPKKAGGKYNVGDVVEDVTLLNEDNKEVSFKSLYEESGLVVFSYPKANTPGCTTQACSFRDASPSFSSLGYTVFGLSRDKPTQQSNWKAKHELGYSLLSDPEQVLLKRLGATESQKRCHWVIAKGGELLEAKIGVKPADDSKNALEFIKSLSNDEKKDTEKEE